MNQQDESNEESGSGIKLHDVLVSVFKHKWKVIFCALAGLAGAVVVWFTHSPVYESKAKIFVKSVPVYHADDMTWQQNFDDGIIQPEVEILGSWDVAGAVAKKIGPERIVPMQVTGDRDGAAAFQVMKNHEILTTPRSKVIEVVYKHPNAETAVMVLNEMLAQYELAHNRVHHPPEIFESMDLRKAERLAELKKIDLALKEKKGKANVNNLADSASLINALMSKARLELQTAGVKLAGQRARVADLEKVMGIAAATENSDKPSLPPPNPADVQEYQSFLQLRADLRKKEQDLLGHLQPQSSEVQNIRAQIKSCEAELAKLSKANPAMNNAASPLLARENSKVDINVERAQLSDLEAQYTELEKASAAAEKTYGQFLELAPEIDALEKEKVRVSDALASVEKKMDDMRNRQLDQKNLENIEIIQKPSPPTPSTDKLLKIVMGLAAGGLAAGLGLVFLREFVFDQTVRQPLELETRLGIPLMISIPERTNGLRERKTDSAQIVPWEEGHFIRPYAEAIRDRLVLQFEQSGLIRKPKLVGVTGWTAGAGTTTLASGLAAALSETGDGKVLLVDMNVRGGEVHPFFKGQAAALLPDALLSSDNVKSTAENLYIATATTQNGEMEIIPKRFYNMIPNFKASDYDYIIFDMPPLSKGSMTLAMAGFMDRMLLVVEAEKDNRNVLARACAELANAKANLCGVLNKVRTYGPRWLQEA